MVKTMAVKIDRNTYPIAVACLAGGFAAVPFHRVKGSYLVINELAGGKVKQRGYRPWLGNTWQSESSFRKQYRFLQAEEKGRFSEVEKI